MVGAIALFVGVLVETFDEFGVPRTASSSCRRVRSVGRGHELMLATSRAAALAAPPFVRGWRAACHRLASHAKFEVAILAVIS